MKSCNFCLMNKTVSSLKIDKKGRCQFCLIHQKMENEYPLNKNTKKELEKIVNKIKLSGKGKKYDCICGISGGRDSSYMLYYVKEILGLRPLAVHYDNGFNSDISVRNIYNICEKLEVDLETEVENWDNFKEILRALFISSVPDVDIATDIGIFKTMYKFADKEKIKYVVNGHNFRSEGLDPLVWTYMDPLYLKDICKKHNPKVNLKKFNNFYLRDIFQYKFIKRIKTFLPLNYINLNYSQIEKKLTEEYGWKFYDAHHYESLFTKFLVGYYLPQKFNIDRRITDLSAEIRSNKISKKSGQDILNSPIKLKDKDKVIKYVLSKLDFNDEEWEVIMNSKNKNYKDFNNYLNYFKFLKFFVIILVKIKIIPMILYLKFFEQ